jgi:hypothetical protein
VDAHTEDAEGTTNEARNSMRDLDLMLEEQRQRRRELGAYMEHLKVREDSTPQHILRQVIVCVG